MITVSRSVEADTQIVSVRAELIDACIARGFYPDYDTWNEQMSNEPDGRLRCAIAVELSTYPVKRRR